MAKKKDFLIDEAEKIRAELDELKKKKKILDSSLAKKTKKVEAKPAKKTKKVEAKPAKKTKKVEAKPAKKTKKVEAKPAKKTKKVEAKPAKKTKKVEAKPAKKTKKVEAKPAKKTKKVEAKPEKVKKLTKKELEEIKKEEEKTLEEELEEQLSDKEIENFQIEKVDMERLTNKVCDILAEHESNGMFQSELWKKLKLTSRDGSRLALKLERMGTITREKLLEKGRWTYKLILKKTPISTQSIENAPCLVCPVEQKCSLDGEISPRNCQFIEDWVIAEMKKPVKTK
jgi:DNA-binding MarR family transcriptional regulator